MKSFLKILLAAASVLAVSLPVNAEEGKNFPAIQGKNLAGEEVQYPKNFYGKATFMVLGYSMEVNQEATQWLNKLNEKFGKREKVNIVMLPMMGDNPASKIGGFFMENKLKKNMPKQEHKLVMPVYMAVEPIKKSLSYQEKQDLYVYLVDEKGKIVLEHKGVFSEENLKKFAEKLESVLK